MASPMVISDDMAMDSTTQDEERAADLRRRRRSSASASRSRSSRRSRSHSASHRHSRSRSASSNRSYQTPEESWSRPDALHYKPVLILRGHKRGVSGVKFSPDGKRIASCSADATIKIWDAESGRLEHTLEGHMAGISCIAWSPDSTILASGSDDKVIRLWDVIKVCALRPAFKAHPETRAVILTWRGCREKLSPHRSWDITITSTRCNSRPRATCLSVDHMMRLSFSGMCELEG